MRIDCYYQYNIEDEGLENEAELVPMLMVYDEEGNALFGDNEKYRAARFPCSYEYYLGVDSLLWMIKEVVDYQEFSEKTTYEDKFILAKETIYAKISNRRVSVNYTPDMEEGFVGDISIDTFLTIAQIWYLYIKSSIQEEMTFYIEEK